MHTHNQKHGSDGELNRVKEMASSNGHDHLKNLRVELTMRPSMKNTYYSVTALQDGTIYFAFQTRKPVKSNVTPRPQIDEDGIHTWYFEKQEKVRRCTDWAKGVHHSAIVNSLNMKRLIRERVEARLERIETRLGELSEKLSRIELVIK